MQEQALGPGHPVWFQGQADYQQPPDLTGALMSGRHCCLVGVPACREGGTLRVEGRVAWCSWPDREA